MSLRLKILAGPPSASSPPSDGSTNFGDRPDDPRRAGPHRDPAWIEWRSVGQGEIRMGRHPASDLELPYPGISVLHARLFRQPDRPGWWLEDLGSSNGTWLGDVRLRQGTPSPVGKGDAFRMAAVTVKIEEIDLERDAASSTGGTESTATMGRRLIVGGLVPPGARSASLTTSDRLPEPVQKIELDPAKPATGASRRASSRAEGAATIQAQARAWPASRIIVVVFAAAMTLLAVAGLIALALALR